MLLDAMSTIGAPDNFDHTPLHFCTDEVVAALLLQKGYSPLRGDRLGNTAGTVGARCALFDVVCSLTRCAQCTTRTGPIMWCVSATVMTPIVLLIVPCQALAHLLEAHSGSGAHRLSHMIVRCCQSDTLSAVRRAPRNRNGNTAADVRGVGVSRALPLFAEEGDALREVGGLRLHDGHMRDGAIGYW